MLTIDDTYYGSAYINSVSNRFFDYLDANIPIIATRPKKLCDYFESFRVIVKMDISNINIEYLKKHRILYKENVKKAKKEFLIDNQIYKLINFFNEL